MARKINELIWHCTATPEGREVSVAEITAWHKKRKFRTIGYHKLVHLDGTVSEGRPESQNGAHVQGHNTGTLGYAYVGGMAAYMSGPKDTRTPAQKQTMERLTREAVAKYGITKISGHNEYANKACPSFDVRTDPLGQLAGAGAARAESAVSPQPAPASQRLTPQPAASAASVSLIRAVQEALLEKGYPEVGRADGAFGPKTRGAILAFEADNSLQLTGKVSGELLAQILAAEPRHQAPERVEATPKEVREKVPEVQASWLAKVISQVMAAGGVAWAALSGMSEQVGPAQEMLAPVLALAGNVPGWLYGLIIAGGAFLLWQKFRGGEQGGLAAFRSGERR